MPEKPKPRPMVVPPLSQDELRQFGNWTGQTDTKVMARDLQKRGLIGAEQLVMDNPNVTSASSIRNAQSDWKVSAIQEILANARRFNLRTPEEINANRDVLVQNSRWREGINNPYFTHIHPNFFDVISKSILPEQYTKEESRKLLAKK